MPDDSKSPPLSQALKNLNDRLGAVEALLTNVYAKYYLEQYQQPASEAEKSLAKATGGRYELYTNYSFIDTAHEGRVRTLIKDFFTHLDSIIAMNTAKENSFLSLASSQGKVDVNNPQYKAVIQKLIHKNLPQFSSLFVDQAYEIFPSSDLVLRVWLNDDKTQKPLIPLILKTLGSNQVRNDIVDKYGLFYREASFYSSMADAIREHTPICYYASVEESLIIMEDRGVAVVGDQIYGYTAEEAFDVISAIIPLHEFWLNKQPECFLPQVNDPQITDVLPEMLTHVWGVTRHVLNSEKSAIVDSIINDLIANIKPIADELSVHSTIIHGDLRMENLLFHGAKLDAIIDWQLLSIGSPMVDVAYFLVQSGCKDERQQVEAKIIASYAEKFSHSGMNRERLNLEYALAAKYSLIMPIMAAASDMHEFGKPRDSATSAFHRTIETIA